MRRLRRCENQHLSASLRLVDVCQPPGASQQAEGQRLDALRLLVVLENPGKDVTLGKERAWAGSRSTRKAPRSRGRVKSIPGRRSRADAKQAFSKLDDAAPVLKVETGATVPNESSSPLTQFIEERMGTRLL
jgi:hypothetical protein